MSASIVSVRAASARRVAAALVVGGALVACPAAATAAITTEAATIDGVASTSAPPGSVMNASVTADVDGGSTWRATSVQFGSESPVCVDHDNEGSGSNRRASFKVTAPGDPGSYDVALHAQRVQRLQRQRGHDVDVDRRPRGDGPGPEPQSSSPLRDQRDARARRVGLDRLVGADGDGEVGDPGVPQRPGGDRRQGLDHRLQHHRGPAGALHDGHARHDRQRLRPLPPRTATGRAAGRTGRRPSRRCARRTPRARWPTWSSS